MGIRQSLRFRTVGQLSLLLLCSTVLFTPKCRAQSQYVRDAHKDSVIVFVHGVLGDSRSTWTNTTTHAYWPSLMTNDSFFNDFDIFVIGYPGSIFHTTYKVAQLGGAARR